MGKKSRKISPFLSNIIISKGDDSVLQLHSKMMNELLLLKNLPKQEKNNFLQERKDGCSIELSKSNHHVTSRVSDIKSAISEADEKSILIVPCSGFMQREHNFYSRYGYATSSEYLESIVELANRSQNIAAIIFRVNSPGGTSQGNESLSNIIASCSKITVSLFDQMTSAALEAFKSCDYIFATERSAKIGSYGEFARYVDLDKVFEIEDAVFEAYAPQSTKKNEEVRALKQNNDFNPLLNLLSKNVELMISSMNEQRPQISSNIWQDGRLMNAVEAIEIKLCDGIKSLRETVDFISVEINKTSNTFSRKEEINQLVKAAFY